MNQGKQYFLKKYFITNPHNNQVLLRETLSLHLVPHNQELMEENEIEPSHSKSVKMSKPLGSNFLTYMLEDEPQ